MKQTIKFQRVSLFRRICSIFFDFILCISVFFIIQALIVQPIFESTTDYYEKYQEYNEVLEDTGLYIYYEEVDGVSIVNMNYDEHLTDFYNSEYAKELGYDLSTYNKLKWENSDKNSEQNWPNEPLFICTIDGEKEIYKDNIYKLDEQGNFTTEIDTAKNDAVIKFYDDLVNKLVKEIQSIKKIEKLTQVVTAYTMLFYIIAFIPAVLITYLLFPMIFKDGTTLGKKMLQMRVIDSKSGKNPSKLQTFTRFVFFAFIQLALGLSTYGVIPVISIAMIIINKKRQTIHDLISSTLVVRNNYSENSNTQKEDIIEIEYDDGIIDVSLKEGEQND